MPAIAPPARASRSAVPDLLFEDEQHARIREIQAHLADAATVPPDAPLHRLTVFLTYRCNLDCPYCKTIARTPAELERRGASVNARCTKETASIAVFTRSIKCGKISLL